MGNRSAEVKTCFAVNKVSVKQEWMNNCLNSECRRAKEREKILRCKNNEVNREMWKVIQTVLFEQQIINNGCKSIDQTFTSRYDILLSNAEMNSRIPKKNPIYIRSRLGNQIKIFSHSALRTPHFAFRAHN